MKNNSLAMLAVISLAVAIGSIVGYIDPSDCTVANQDAFLSCEDVAAQHISAFWIFGIFGLLTLAGSAVRAWVAKRPR